jgi:hypothetical protein
MSRILLICSFATLLAACGTTSANDIQSANQIAWTQARLACADVGVDPGSAAFGPCTADLYNALWDEQNEAER